MDDILRFPSAVKRDPAIDAWLGAQRDDLRPLAETWFARMRRRGGDVRELMHDGCPTACVGDAAFGYVNAFKDHVNVGFFRGALLKDPAGLLQGTGKRGRDVKLWPGREVDAAAVAQLVDAAYVGIRTRLTDRTVVMMRRGNAARVSKVIRHVFGLVELRPGQQAVIDAVLAKRHTLAVMPTGAGKSLCYGTPKVGILDTLRCCAAVIAG